MTERFDLKAALWAGIAAGAVFLIAEILLVTLVGGESPWAPPRMMAAIALGEGVLPPPASFDLGVVLAALAVHFALAIVYGVAFGLAVAALKAGPGTAVALGLAFGVALYVVNFYVFTGLFPWFAMARNWMSILAHGLYGLVLGAAYVRLAAPRVPGTGAPV